MVMKISVFILSNQKPLDPHLYSSSSVSPPLRTYSYEDIIEIVKVITVTVNSIQLMLTCMKTLNYQGMMLL